MAEKDQTLRLMDQVAEELLKPFQEPIHSVYMDADFLYDYRLAALILKLSTQDQFTYLKEHIQDYAKGSSRHITKYFPRLGFTESEIDLMERDAAWSSFLHVAAPQTGFLSRLPDFLAKLNTYNQAKEIQHPLRLIINQRHTIIPEKIWSDLVSYIRQKDVVTVIDRTNYHSWDEVPEEEFKSWSMVLVHDLVDFVRQGTTSQKCLMNKLCLDKIVLSPCQTEEDFDDPEKEKMALTNFSAIMSLMVSEFSFVEKSIPMER